MKELSLAVSMFVLALPAAAGISSGWSRETEIVVAASEPRTTAVSLVMPAEFVSVPVRVQSDQRNAALAYQETRQAIEMISQKVKDNGSFRISMGVVSLSQHRGGFGISSGSWNQPAASADIYILVPFAKGRENIFAAGADAARFVESLIMPGKTKCEVGTLQLAVENPEQYRARLLGLVAEEIKKTREAMAPQASVNVEGLESPVRVRQVDDRNVELFLSYSLSIATDK